jgi:hypothetical protein
MSSVLGRAGTGEYGETVTMLGAVASRGSSWLLERIGPAGEPSGAERVNAWWRVPWALTVAGHRDAAVEVLAWAEREALTDDGDLRPGPAGGDRPGTPVYQLAHLSLAAHLLNRFDTATVLFDKVMEFQNRETGGVFAAREITDDRQELLLTAQLGVLAVLVGRIDVAESVYGWFDALWAAQPELDRQRLYTMWSDGSLLIVEGPGDLSRPVVDFSLPRQAYFHPGAAAAFLANFGARTRTRAPLELATSMMRLNINGTKAQFDDNESVQICKFGWGAAEMLTADPDGGWAPHVQRMATWFTERQLSDGSWAPSTFTLGAEPQDTDKMWKTAEHLMEVVQMSTALSGIRSQPFGPGTD